MAIRKQLSVTMENRPGTLAEMCRALGEKKVNILAMISSEGAGVNHGWADYRDHHLGPELETVRELRASQLRGRAQVCAWQR